MIRICIAISSPEGQSSQIYSGASAIEISAASEEILATLAMNSQVAPTAPPIAQLQPELHAEGGGHALAALETEEYRVQVTEKGRRPRPARIPASLRSSRWQANTGMKPLRLSPSRVMAAAFLPPMRSTLVAPGLFEPCVRGSGRPISRQTMIALDIDPSR